MVRVYLHKETGAVIFADFFIYILREAQEEEPSPDIIKKFIKEHEKWLSLGFELVDYEKAFEHITQNIFSKERQDKIRETIKKAFFESTS
jgi:hypothetical protein